MNGAAASEPIPIVRPGGSSGSGSGSAGGAAVGQSPVLGSEFRLPLPSMLTAADGDGALSSDDDDEALVDVTDPSVPFIAAPAAHKKRGGGELEAKARASSSSDDDGVVSPRPARRLQSLDAFRGAAVFLMIVVNTPGSRDATYAQLAHSTWDGLTVCDLVFPFFLFMVGVSLWLGRQKVSARRVARRVGVLFVLGLLLGLCFDFDVSSMRVMGVLQRISITYLLAVAVVVVLQSARARILALLALLGTYLALLYALDVPGCGRGSLEPECNAAAYLDKNVLGSKHMLNEDASCFPECAVFEPEGLLSTLTATATVLLGAEFGALLTSAGSTPGLLLRLWTGSSLALTVVGAVMSVWLPLNKNLWSLSFTILSAGIAGLVLTVFYILVDKLRMRRGAAPLISIGRNSLFVYALSVLVAEAAEELDVYDWWFENVFESWLPAKAASLVFALVYALAFAGIAALMDWKGWFVVL